MSIHYHTEEERLVAEQAVAAYREAQKAMAAAPHGQAHLRHLDEVVNVVFLVK